jgi:hypothetical protein
MGNMSTNLAELQSVAQEAQAKGVNEVYYDVLSF